MKRIRGWRWKAAAAVAAAAVTATAFLAGVLFRTEGPRREKVAAGAPLSREAALVDTESAARQDTAPVVERKDAGRSEEGLAEARRPEGTGLGTAKNTPAAGV